MIVCDHGADLPNLQLYELQGSRVVCVSINISCWNGNSKIRVDRFEYIMTNGPTLEFEAVGHKSANHISVTQADDANEADRCVICWSSSFVDSLSKLKK